MLLQVSQFSPFALLLLLPLPSSIPPLVHVHGSCMGSLASPFPILFLTSPCLFSTYQLYFLITVPFPPFSFPVPADNSADDIGIYDTVPILLSLVCLGFF